MILSFCPMKLENIRGYALYVFVILAIGTDMTSKKNPKNEIIKDSWHQEFQTEFTQQLPGFE